MSAATNGMSAAQLIVHTGPRSARVSSLGWITGRQEFAPKGRRFRVDYRNYLQTEGVKPGSNSLSVSLQSGSGRCLDQIDVLPGTSVVATTARPDELRLLAPARPITATVGESARLPFALERRGSRPDIGFDVRVLLPEEFEPMGGTTRRLNGVDRRGEGEFEFVPRKPGRYVLSIGVTRQYNQPKAAVEVVVVEPASWITSRFVPSLVAATFLVGAAGFTWASRNRRRDR